VTKALEKFPVRYDVHKYLGRKPWYIVREIIAHYSRPAETVMDLFSGSGVAAFESLALGRNAIAVDSSPLSELITRSLCEAYDAGRYMKMVTSILPELKSYQELYRVEFQGKKGILRYWQPKLNLGKIFFPEDGSTYNGDLTDAKQVSAHNNLHSFRWTHAETPLPIIKGNNVSKWGEIFTERGEYILSQAFSSVGRVNNPALKRCLFVALSASIEKISLLNRFKTGGGGWLREKPLCYYKSDDFIEFNAVDALESKMLRMGTALAETNGLLKDNVNFTFLREKVENIRYSNKADLIVMDPPYLDEVLYDKLEALHDVWLGFSPSKQDIRFAFNIAAKKACDALKRNGTLVLLMHNYLPESKNFLVNGLLDAGLAKTKEIQNPGRKKEGLSITVFQKG
jgi:16S rRNA G966 N2-methylase RsmD